MISDVPALIAIVFTLQILERMLLERHLRTTHLFLAASRKKKPFSLVAHTWIPDRIPLFVD